MKLDSDQKQSILDFISENWSQFVEHVAGRECATTELAEGLADEIVEALTEEVQYG